MEIVDAGIIIFVVIFVAWFIRDKWKGGKPSRKTYKATKRVGKFLAWMNLDMVSSAGIFLICAWIWMQFNIDYGNVKALEWAVNKLSDLSGNPLSPSFNTLRIAAAIPSIIEWWLLQFSPEGSLRHKVGWGIIGGDVGVTAFGFWVAVPLTLNIWEWTLIHFIMSIAFVIGAAIVNVFIELVGHDCLARFWLTLRSQSAKGALT